MLNLRVAMLSVNFFFSVFLFLFSIWPVFVPSDLAVQSTPVRVSEPRSGEALQGLVEIRGTTDLPGFRLAEVSFGYQEDPTDTWFIIEQSTTPVSKDIIARWDTSMITDGQYRLRVRVEFAGQQEVEFVVTNLRVRNYTPIETSTPDVNQVLVLQPTATMLSDYVLTGATPVPLPTNPAQLTVDTLRGSALRGMAYVVAGAVLMGIYWWVRTMVRH